RKFHSLVVAQTDKSLRRNHLPPFPSVPSAFNRTLYEHSNQNHFSRQSGGSSPVARPLSHSASGACPLALGGNSARTACESRKNISPRRVIATPRILQY